MIAFLLLLPSLYYLDLLVYTMISNILQFPATISYNKLKVVNLKNQKKLTVVIMMYWLTVGIIK